MSKIKYFIGPQNVEIIRDRIAAILADEFEEQFLNFYNTDCEHVDFYVERHSAIDKSELYIVNVSVDNATFDNEHYGSVDGAYLFNIDTYTNSKSVGDEDGDKLAMFKAQRITGIIRAILANPIYKRLDYTFPMIENTRVEGFKSMNLKNTAETDALSTTISRLQFFVKANQGVTIPPGTPIHENNSTIGLGLTVKGFKIIFNM